MYVCAEYDDGYTGDGSGWHYVDVPVTITCIATKGYYKLNLTHCVYNSGNNEG